MLLEVVEIDFGVISTVEFFKSIWLGMTICSLFLFFVCVCVQEIAELYESEHNIEQTIIFFEKAADMFQNEEVTTSANQCKQKVAQYAAELEQ